MVSAVQGIIAISIIIIVVIIIIIMCYYYYWLLCLLLLMLDLNLKFYGVSRLSNKNEKIFVKNVLVGGENLKIAVRGFWLINNKIAHEF